MKSYSCHGRKAAACLICAFFIICAIFVATPVNAAEALDAKITVSYDFQEDFDMIFNCKVYSSGNFENVRLSVEFNGETVVLTPDFDDPETGLYRFTFRGVSAAEMTYVAKATLIANIGNTEYKSEVKQACIRDYAMALINFYDDIYNSDTKAKKLCTAYVDMLNYGAAAQKYFGKNTSNLANKNLTSAQQKMASSLPTSASSCYNKKALSNATAEIQKIALSFENPVDLVVYSSFSSAPGSGVSAQISYTDSSNSTKTIKVPSSAFEYQQNDNLYRVEFKDIPLDSLTTPLTVVFKNNTKDISATITYSCESYAKSILGGDYDANVKDLVKKMLAYGDSAKAYAATLPTGCVTYRQFGAMGNFVDLKDNNKIDDYYAIVMTHDYANNKKLPVKADNAAHYYAAYMDPRTVDGGQIKTNTDWGNANFTINDRNLNVQKDENGKPYIPEPDRYCALFTVKSFQKSGYKWVITTNNNNKGIFLGLDPNLPDYPEYNGVNLDMAKNMTNKTLSVGQKQIPGNFRMKALYYLKTESYLRWGRNDNTQDKPRPQAEVFVVDKEGNVDSRGPIQWPWKDICTIKYFPIDDDVLTVKGGTFTTIVNDQNVRTYIRRGIVINRSNTLIEDVVHKLAGEENKFPADYDHSTGKKASYGAPYQGFYHPELCAYVTLKNCKFTDHYHVSDGTYDLDAEFVVGLTIDHCTCLPINMNGFKNTSSNYSEPTGIMDPLRWGTTGTNYCKDIKVINHSVISRLDAHKGAYGLTVKDSTLGQRGVAAVGFGKMTIENSRILSDNFISLRQDFGSFWDGDIYIKNCTWRIDKPFRGLIRIAYDPTFNVGYEPIYDKKGNRYYSTLPNNVYIDGLTIDATNLAENGGNAFYTRGFNIYDMVLKNTGMNWTQVIDEDYISRANAPSYEAYIAKVYNTDPNLTASEKAALKNEALNDWGYPYYFPIRTTETVTVDKNKVHVIRRKNVQYQDGNKLNGIFLRNGNNPQINDAYFFEKESDKTLLVFDPIDGKETYSSSDPIDINTYTVWDDN